MDLDVALRVYFVSWAEIPATTYETFVKKIRDKIGANFKLNNSASGVWVDSITELFGEMPVYFFDISLVCRYYLDETST
jgi:hypothetical protein